MQNASAFLKMWPEFKKKKLNKKLKCVNIPNLWLKYNTQIHKQTGFGAVMGVAAFIASTDALNMFGMLFDGFIFDFFSLLFSLQTENVMNVTFSDQRNVDSLAGISHY